MGTHTKKTVKVSVIIPTLNRDKILCDTLSYLLQQEYHFFEIIVVDQSETHNKETQDFLKEHEDDLKYFQINERGTTIAKNFGLKQATGEIVLFLDDDIKPVENLIGLHVRHYRDQKIGGVGGRVVVEDNSMNSAKESVVGQVTKDGRFIDNFSSQTSTEIMTVHGCNASFRRNLLEQIHGFDENYTGNAIREETDLSFRIRRLGYRLVFDPQAEVLHYKSSGGGSRNEKRIQWYEDFFRNEMFFFLKFFNHWLIPLRVINKLRPILSCMFYYGKGKKKALIAPWKGFWDGYQLYRREVKDQSVWL